MPTTITKYGKVGAHFANKNIDLDTDTIKVFLLKSTYTPNLDTHEFESDLVLASNEISTTSTYTKGTGLTLTLTKGAYSAANDNTPYDADDLTIASSTIAEVSYAVIVDQTPGSAATNPLIALIAFDSTSTTNQEFKIAWNASGVIAI